MTVAIRELDIAELDLVSGGGKWSDVIGNVVKGAFGSGGAYAGAQIGAEIGCVGGPAGAFVGALIGIAAGTILAHNM